MCIEPRASFTVAYAFLTRGFGSGCVGQLIHLVVVGFRLLLPVQWFRCTQCFDPQCYFRTCVCVERVSLCAQNTHPLTLCLPACPQYFCCPGPVFIYNSIVYFSCV